MTNTELLTVIKQEILRFTEENDIQVSEIDDKTRLMGSKGVFDSLDLVTFIVELEENLMENFSIEVELTSDRALSRRTSPFINPETLASFILDQIHETV